MQYKDYYRVLGLERSAGADEIKRAYRRLARKYHPDANPGDSAAEDRFKEVNEAHQVLSDPEKKARYDRFGNAYRQSGSYESAMHQAGFGGGGFAETGPFGPGTGFSEFFEQLFGAQGPARSRPGAVRRSRAADVSHEIDVTLQEVLNGSVRIISVRAPDGAGGAATRRLRVKIPAGVRPGARIRLAGEGGVRPDSTRGDLFLKVNVLDHPDVRRLGADLETDIEISMTAAALGTSALVSTLDGQTLRVQVPPEVSQGSRLRLRGKGLPVMGKPDRGDLFVKVSVTTPKDLTEEQRSLILELAKLRGEIPETADAH